MRRGFADPDEPEPEGTKKLKGGRPCKICGHPARAEIEAMILNGASYAAIINRAKVAFPKEPELSDKNISYHRTKHLLTKPIATTEIDPETGELKMGYLIGHLSKTIEVRKEDLPKSAPTLPEALRTIINAGIRNIMIDPATVTPAILMLALETARKLNLGSGDEDDFKEAWGALGVKKNAIKERASRAKRTRRVTIEETTEEERDGQEAEGEVIDAEPVRPELPDPDWSIDSLIRSVPDDEAAAVRRAHGSE
jgi:hypothetical protein